MGFFPAMINLDDQDVLVVGAGRVALHKITKLLQFKCKITVVSPSALAEVTELNRAGDINLISRDYQGADLVNKFMVVVGVDSLDLQKNIYEECTKRKIMVNCVDSVDYCSFTFPAMICRDDVTISISTGGKAPSAAAYLRQSIEKLLPNDLGDSINAINSFRNSQAGSVDRDESIRERTTNVLSSKLL